MRKDKILRIEIDFEGKLLIRPEESKFPMIYRTAAEIHWDAGKNSVYSPALPSSRLEPQTPNPKP